MVEHDSSDTNSKYYFVGMTERDCQWYRDFHLSLHYSHSRCCCLFQIYYRHYHRYHHQYHHCCKIITIIIIFITTFIFYRQYHYCWQLSQWPPSILSRNHLYNNFCSYNLHHCLVHSLLCFPRRALLEIMIRKTWHVSTPLFGIACLFHILRFCKPYETLFPDILLPWFERLVLTRVGVGEHTRYIQNTRTCFTLGFSS